MRRKLIIKMLILSLVYSVYLSVNQLVVFATSEGWSLENNKWKYSNGSNYVTGWQNINNNWYWFDSNGVMFTGWLNEEKSWYYLNSDGTMAHDRWIGDYYLSSSGEWDGSKEMNNDHVNIPNVRGLTVEEAETRLKTAGFTFTVKNIDVSNQSQDGKVLEQSLSGEAAKGVNIELEVGKYKL